MAESHPSRKEISELLSLPEIKAQVPLQEVFVRFYNRAAKPIDVFWIDYSGNPFPYAQIGVKKSLSVRTFFGHPWIFRQCDNGAVAVCGPNADEVFCLLLPETPYLGVQSISVDVFLKVNSLLNISVGCVADTLKPSELQNLPLPVSLKKEDKEENKTAMVVAAKIRRLNPPTVEEIIKDLKSSGGQISDVIERVLATRGFPLLLTAIQAISDFSFRVDPLLLERFRTEFALFGSETAFNHVSTWLMCIESGRNARNNALLVSCLVRSADILQNKKLRTLLRQSIPPLYISLYANGDKGIAGILLQSLFFASAVEANYSDDADLKEIELAWDQLIRSPASKSPHLLLALFLIEGLVERNGSNLIQTLCKEKLYSNLSEHSDDPCLCVRTQFFAFLSENLAPVVSRCSLLDGYSLVEALVRFREGRNELCSAAQFLLDEQRLFGDCSKRIACFFFRSFLVLLAENIMIPCNAGESKRLAAQRNKSLNMWFLQLAESIKDEEQWEQIPPEKRHLSKKLWKRTVTACVASSTSDEDRKPGFEVSNDILSVLLGETYSLETLPLSVRSALLGVYVILLKVFSSTALTRVLSSALKIIRSEKVHCHKLIGSVEANNVYKLLESNSGMAYDTSDLCEFWKEYLQSSTGSESFIEKAKFLLPIDSNTSVFFTGVIMDILYERDNNVLGKKADSANDFFCNQLRPAFLKRFSARIEKCDTNDVVALEKFVDFLKPLHQMQQFMKRLNIQVADDTTFTKAVQVCEKICKKCSKFIPLDGQNETNKVKIIKLSVEFLCHQAKLSALLKWRYLANILEYDCVIVKEIFLFCSLAELEALFGSRKEDVSKHNMLKLYIIIAQLQNIRKQKILLMVLDSLMEYMCDEDCKEIPESLRLGRLLLQHVANGNCEQDFVSFILSLISVSSSFFFDSKCVNDEYAKNALEIEETLLDCLRLCSSSVLNDQCALYAELVSSIARFVQWYGESKLCSEQILAQLSYKLAKIAQAMSTHKSFVRIAPFVISECLENPKCCRLAVHKLLSVCDTYSMAVLTSSLPAAQKHQFAALYPQYRKASAFTV